MKGLFKVLWWEGVGDRTELQYLDPHSYGRQRCVFLVLQGYSTGGTEAHSAGCGLSLPHLVTNGSPNTVGGSEGPFGREWLSLPHLISNFSGPQLIRGSKGRFGLVWPSLPHLVYNSNINCLTSVLTELYNSSTSTQSPTQSLEWPGWSSSSGNNCHAVHRSLSSGASFCSGTVGPSPCPILSALIRPRDLFRLLAIGMCPFLPAHHFGMACLPRPKI